MCTALYESHAESFIGCTNQSQKLLTLNIPSDEVKSVVYFKYECNILYSCLTEIRLNMPSRTLSSELFPGIHLSNYFLKNND